MGSLGLGGEVSPVLNVLANRYASPEMAELFSPDAQVVLERDLWIAVMEEQIDGGVQIEDLSQDAIEDYRGARGIIDHESIRDREKVTRHDVKARIEEFNELAGHELVHTGMTSRDATDNVEQMQIRSGLEIIRFRSAALLGRFAARAVAHTELVMAGRSHNVAAQTITLGKRFATWGEEHLTAHENLEETYQRYALRGIKGPVGTQQDMLDLFEGDTEKLEEFEQNIAARLGFTAVMNSVGQVYPRSQDYDVVTALHGLHFAPSNFALTTRLMAGSETATEGFKKGQTGSSAMPHKMNARTSERINGFKKIMAGYAAMAAANAGDQWNEGDVSCSVLRRVMIPDSFFATDGMLEAAITVLDDYGPYPAVIEKELDRYLPFLTTTKALMTAVKSGAGREVAHAAIKKHATAVALEMREDGIDKNDLFERLASDPDLGVTVEQLDDAIGNPIELTGNAGKQVQKFVNMAEEVLAKHKGASEYRPGQIL